jgi:hypothetical protein
VWRGDEDDAIDHREQLVILHVECVALGSIQREARFAVVAALLWLLQVAQQLTDIEAARRVADERDGIARLEFMPCHALREKRVQAGCARGDGTARQVVEVVQHGMLAGRVCGQLIEPLAERAGRPRVVFDLPERIEACKARYQNDMRPPHPRHARDGTPSVTRVHGVRRGVFSRSTLINSGRDVVHSRREPSVVARENTTPQVK